jgi:hypothetical protein
MTKLLTLFLLTAFTDTLLLGQESSPVAFFSFDGNFRDAANNITYNNTNTENLIFSTDRFGNENSCLSVKKYLRGGVKVPFEKEKVFSKSRNMTITAWFKKTSSKYGLDIIRMDYKDVNMHSSRQTFDISVGPEDISVFRSFNTQFGYSLYDGNWHFIACTFKDSSLSIMVDLKPLPDIYGFSKFQKPLIEELADYKSFDIGGYAESGSYVDDIFIFNRLLSFSEIKNLFFSKPQLNELPPFKSPDTEPRTYFKNYYQGLIKYYIESGKKDSLLKCANNKLILTEYYDEDDLRKILSLSDIAVFSNTAIYNNLKIVKAKMTEESKIVAENEKKLLEIESKRIGYIKKAAIGDLMIYTQDWQKTESYLFGFYKKNTPYTMIIKCYIERIEGEKYQVRIAEISSSDNQTYSTPEIKGIKIYRGDIIWVKPLQDKNWFWGEDE